MLLLRCWCLLTCHILQSSLLVVAETSDAEDSVQQSPEVFFTPSEQQILTTWSVSRRQTEDMSPVPAAGGAPGPQAGPQAGLSLQQHGVEDAAAGQQLQLLWPQAGRSWTLCGGQSLEQGAPQLLAQVPGTLTEQRQSCEPHHCCGNISLHQSSGNTWRRQ